MKLSLAVPSHALSCELLTIVGALPPGISSQSAPDLVIPWGKSVKIIGFRNKWPVVLMHADGKAVAHQCCVELGSAIFLQVDLVTHTVFAVLSELQRYHSRIGFCSACARCVLKPFDEEVMTSLKRRCCLLSRRPHWAAFCGPAESTGQRNFLKMT